MLSKHFWPVAAWILHHWSCALVSSTGTLVAVVGWELCVSDLFKRCNYCDITQCLVKSWAECFYHQQRGVFKPDVTKSRGHLRATLGCSSIHRGSPQQVTLHVWFSRFFLFIYFFFLVGFCVSVWETFHLFKPIPKRFTEVAERWGQGLSSHRLLFILSCLQCESSLPAGC